MEKLMRVPKMTFSNLNPYYKSTQIGSGAVGPLLDTQNWEIDAVAKNNVFKLKSLLQIHPNWLWSCSTPFVSPKWKKFRMRTGVHAHFHFDPRQFQTVSGSIFFLRRALFFIFAIKAMRKSASSKSSSASGLPANAPASPPKIDTKVPIQASSSMTFSN